MSTATAIPDIDHRTHFLCEHCWQPFPLAEKRSWYTTTWAAAYDGDDGCNEPCEEQICVACYDRLSAHNQKEYDETVNADDGPNPFDED